MKNLIIIAIMLIFSVKLTSQELPDFISNEPIFEKKGELHKFYLSEKRTIKNELQTSAVLRRTYDVLAYELYLDWYDLMNRTGVNPADRVWSAKLQLSVLIDSNKTDHIELDSYNQTINSIFVNGTAKTNFSQPVGGILTVPLNAACDSGTAVLITINYTYNGQNDQGFFLYPKGQYVGIGPAGDTVVVAERLAYFMSEPEEARYWMPCNDRPYDKALITFHCKVPKGYQTAAVGTNFSTTVKNDSVTYNWSSRDIMPTYLMHLAASKYAKISYTYKGSAGNIPVDCYVWPVDSSNAKTDYTVYNAENSFKTTVQMMEIFSNKMCEYPHEKYGMDAVQPFWAGGMEHQTMTTINRSWLRGTSESGIAHELGHQWLGDYITCATWKDIWINEGGATWTEALWAEKDGFDSYISTMMGKRNVYLGGGGQTLPRIYDLVTDLFNVYITYYKSSWVYHMLRMHVGDTQYFRTLNGLLNQYKYKSLETEQFKDYFKKDIPAMADYFDIFFDQWIFKPGHPDFSTVSRIWPKANGYLAKVQISQVQKAAGVPDLFKTKIRIIATDTLTKVSELFEVYMDQKEQTFEINLKNFPHTIRVDNTYTLCVNSNFTLTEVDDNNESSAIVVSPNPVTNGENIAINLPENFKNNFEINIVDNLGNIIIHQNNFNQNSLLIPASNLSAGSYNVIIKNNEKTFIKRFIKY